MEGEKSTYFSEELPRIGVVLNFFFFFFVGQKFLERILSLRKISI